MRNLPLLPGDRQSEFARFGRLNCSNELTNTFYPGRRVKVALGIDPKPSRRDLLHFSKIVTKACTMCNKSSMVCPMGIQMGPLIHEVRTAFLRRASFLRT